MPTLTTTQTTTTAVELSPRLQRKLLTELKAYQNLNDEIKALTEARDARKATIGKLREETGAKSFGFEGFTITRVTGDSSRLNKKKLLEQGVTMGQIANATVTKPKKPYDLITCPGEKVVNYEEQE